MKQSLGRRNQERHRWKNEVTKERKQGLPCKTTVPTPHQFARVTTRQRTQWKLTGTEERYKITVSLESLKSYPQRPLEESRPDTPLSPISRDPLTFSFGPLASLFLRAEEPKIRAPMPCVPLSGRQKLRLHPHPHLIICTRAKQKNQRGQKKPQVILTLLSETLYCSCLFEYLPTLSKKYYLR